MCRWRWRRVPSTRCRAPPKAATARRLWDDGLRYGLIDHQTMSEYIPMISETFWAALSPALKTP